MVGAGSWPDPDQERRIPSQPLNFFPFKVCFREVLTPQFVEPKPQKLCAKTIENLSGHVQGNINQNKCQFKTLKIQRLSRI